MTHYAVIDTNIIVSSLLTKHNDAATVQIMSKIILGEIIPVYSKAILSEYQNVLYRRNFNFDKDVIDMIISLFKQFGVLIEPTATEEVLPDMKDLSFYEVALEIKNGGGYLVTGNLKHFPDKSFIVTASQFLEIINSNKK